MTGPALDPRIAANLRAALKEQVTATAGSYTAPPRRLPRRRWRLAVVSVSAVVLALAGGSIAVAQGLVPLPFRTGAVYDLPLTEGTASTHVGSLTVPLEDLPAGTNGVRFEVECLSPGTISFPDGAGVICSDATDTGPKSRTTYSIDLDGHSGSLRFDASAGMRWSLELTWLQRTPTDWQTNAHGETFGVVKPDGSSPDLVAAIATNGTEGYYRASEYAALTPAPRNPEEAIRWSQLPERTVTIPIYASNGTTVLGQFNLEVNSPEGLQGPAPTSTPTATPSASR